MHRRLGLILAACALALAIAAPKYGPVQWARKLDRVKWLDMHTAGNDAGPGDVVFATGAFSGTATLAPAQAQRRRPHVRPQAKPQHPTTSVDCVAGGGRDGGPGVSRGSWRLGDPTGPPGPPGLSALVRR